MSDTVLQALELALQHEVEYRDHRAQRLASLEVDVTTVHDQIAESDVKIVELRDGIEHWQIRIAALARSAPTP